MHEDGIRDGEPDVEAAADSEVLALLLGSEGPDVWAVDQLVRELGSARGLRIRLATGACRVGARKQRVRVGVSLGGGLRAGRPVAAACAQKGGWSWRRAVCWMAGVLLPGGSGPAECNCSPTCGAVGVCGGCGAVGLLWSRTRRRR